MANVISDETMEYVGILAKLELSDAEKEAAKKDMESMNINHCCTNPSIFRYWMIPPMWNRCPTYFRYRMCSGKMLWKTAMVERTHLRTHRSAATAHL